jgi:predicted aminopeptidase
MSRATQWLIAGVCAASLSACAGLETVAGYLWQSLSGHLRMMNAARPVEDWLADSTTPENLKARLAMSQRIRAYASSELKLPDNPSYHRYADLQRRAAVWNVVAAPPFSLTLKTWCFPLTGCVGYRGYFEEPLARSFAAELKTQGLEVNVYPVPAYSTLGYMNWAGGDPLLNTFINYPEVELARIVFHELAHQRVYVSGDMVFNESFATAVERMGSAQWLAARGSATMRRDFAALEQRREQFRDLTRLTREHLLWLYASDQDETAMAQAKAVVLQNFRERYATLRATWGGEAQRYQGYDDWVATANNASFAAMAAYDELVPSFEALFAREGRDWQRFYAAVERLAALPKAERRKQLKELS